MSKQRNIAALTLLTCALTAQSAERTPSKPAAKTPQPGMDFLEYLGTLESDEENWTDVVNVELPEAKPKSKAAATQAAQAAKAKAKAEAAAKGAGNEK